MTRIKWIPLTFAIGATLSLSGVGIALAFNSGIAVITCLLLALFFIGSGFIFKRKHYPSS